MTTPNISQSRIQQELQELTQSVAGLIENFHRLKNPLVESREKVPQATDQLDKISQQTEAAAHRMLDTIEQITQREEQMIAGLGQIIQLTAKGEYDPISGLAQGLSESANTTLNDAFTIMNTLQFQDITSQQMDHAAALLEDIEDKLQSILHVIGGDEFRVSVDEPKERKQRAYDPHAEVTDNHAKQSDIDNLFLQTKKK
jgi:chemotaxis regulatin CheY-phosphate phosphatase CheZ